MNETAAEFVSEPIGTAAPKPSVPPKILTSVYQAVAAIFVVKLTLTPAAVMLPNGKLPFVVALVE
jgi:hypothetical protein